MNAQRPAVKVPFLWTKTELESPCIFIQMCVCKSCEILQSEEFHIAFMTSRMDSSGRQNYEKVSVYLNLKLSNKPTLLKYLKGFLLELRVMTHFQVLKAAQRKIVIFSGWL